MEELSLRSVKTRRKITEKRRTKELSLPLSSVTAVVSWIKSISIHSKTKRSKNKDEDFTNKLYFEVQYNEFTGGTTGTAWASSAQFAAHGHFNSVSD